LFGHSCPIFPCQVAILELEEQVGADLQKGSALFSFGRHFRRNISANEKSKDASPKRDQSGQKTARERQTKRRGELSELAFVYKAASLGFGVAKPYGDSERYDFILDPGTNDGPSRNDPHQNNFIDSSINKLWRVQIKSTTTLLNGRYHVNSHRRTNGSVVPYNPSEVDFLVAYIIPEDTWYILPIRDILQRTSLLFCSRHDPRSGLYARYREAWSLLRASLR
jgi:hypothetical protein